MTRRSSFLILSLVFLWGAAWLAPGAIVCHGARTETEGHVGWSTPPLDEEEAGGTDPASPPGEPSKAEPPEGAITVDRSQYESLVSELDGLRRRVLAIQDYESALKAKEDALREAGASLDRLQEKLRATEESNVEKDKDLSKCIDRSREMEAELSRERAKQTSWWKRWLSSE